MMKLNEKIRFLRQSHGWSQEAIAIKLDMSVGGYADIERGKTDIKLSRLKQIATLFNIDLIELFSFGEKNTFYITANNSQGDNNHHVLQVLDSKHVQNELEKYQILVEQKDLLLQEKDKEINMLKEMIEMLKQK